jgi:hypothetical protein
MYVELTKGTTMYIDLTTSAVSMRPDLCTLLDLRCMIVNYYEFICDIFYIQPYGERIGSMK